MTRVRKAWAKNPGIGGCRRQFLSQVRLDEKRGRNSGVTTKKVFEAAEVLHRLREERQTQLKSLKKKQKGGEGDKSLFSGGGRDKQAGGEKGRGEKFQ